MTENTKLQDYLKLYKHFSMVLVVLSVVVIFRLCTISFLHAAFETALSHHTENLETCH